jgi:polyvinyl alcohol dehydrogenase (cytochrome)
MARLATGCYYVQMSAKDMSVLFRRFAPLLGASVLQMGCSSDGPENGGAGGGGAVQDASPVVPGSADWTMMGYDIRSTFHNAAETAITVANASSLELSWAVDVGGTVTGAPAIVGDVAYAASGSGISALRVSDGSAIWAHVDDPAASSASVAYSEGVIYVQSVTGVVRALDAATGDRLWEHDPDDHPNIVGFSSPTIAGDLLLVGGGSAEVFVRPENNNYTFRGYTVALDKRTGDRVWKTFVVDPPHNGVSVWSSLSASIDERTAYASTGQNYFGEASLTSDAIFALSLDDGSVKWVFQALAGDVWSIGSPGTGPDYDFGANPIVYDIGDRKLIGAGQKSGDFWVLDRDTGTEVARRNLGPGSALTGGIFTSGAFDGERILTACNGATSTAPGGATTRGAVGTSVLYALDPLTLDILWERQLPDVNVAPITVANGVGFVGANRTLQAFDVETGEVLMSYEADGTIVSPPAVSDGRVIFGAGINYLFGTPATQVHALALP